MPCGDLGSLHSIAQKGMSDLQANSPLLGMRKWRSESEAACQEAPGGLVGEMGLEWSLRSASALSPPCCEEHGSEELRPLAVTQVTGDTPAFLPCCVTSFKHLQFPLILQSLMRKLKSSR